MRTDPDGKPGLRIETASSITARGMIQQHLAAFALVIRRDRMANAATVAEYINGLAGVVALTIAGGHGSKDDVVNATVAKLREYVDRDLAHLKAST